MQSVHDIGIIRLLLILSPLIAINFVLVIVAVLSIARKALPWSQKWVWLLVILLFDLIGPVLYFAIGSGKLDDKVAAIEDSWEARQ